MAWPTLGVTFFRPPFPPLIKNGLTIFNAWGIWAKRGKPCAMHIFREVWNLCAFLMGSKRMTGHQPHQDCVIVLSVEKNSWHLRLGVRFRLLFVGFPKKKNGDLICESSLLSQAHSVSRWDYAKITSKSLIITF